MRLKITHPVANQFDANIASAAILQKALDTANKKATAHTATTTDIRAQALAARPTLPRLASPKKTAPVRSAYLFRAIASQTLTSGRAPRPTSGSSAARQTGFSSLSPPPKFTSPAATNGRCSPRPSGILPWQSSATALPSSPFKRTPHPFFRNPHQ
jgi:hypothetical protein